VSTFLDWIHAENCCGRVWSHMRTQKYTHTVEDAARLPGEHRKGDYLSNRPGVGTWGMRAEQEKKNRNVGT
jgi:hypothetical protein